MPGWLQSLLETVGSPAYGLATVFVTAFLSATFLPLASLPVVLGVIKLNPDLFWPCLLLATSGNTLGGMANWWMGRTARDVVNRHTRWNLHARVLGWLQRIGPPACLLAWLPVAGDPLCAVAGWLRLPLARCAAYMAVGMFARYLVAGALLLGLFPDRWQLA
jgi:membrane protein YqaA with SNARE-associated domain